MSLSTPEVPWCRSKPVRPPFIVGTQIKMFLFESESSQTLHRQQHSWNVPMSRNVASKKIGKMIHVTSRSSVIPLSESHNHSHRHQPQSPDPSHLSIDHLHLRSLINTPINSTCSLTLIVRSTVHYTEQYLTPYALTCVYLPLRLSSDTPVYIFQDFWFSSVDSRSPSTQTLVPCGNDKHISSCTDHRRYLFARYLPSRHSPLFLQFA